MNGEAYGIDKSWNKPRIIDIANCITAREDRGISNRRGEGTAIVEGIGIRKLTPKECFRLQDFDDSDFGKAEAVNSNTQLYKQAGNSITVAVPYYIFKALFDANIL
jgi:site-specific DNA-cytosine methylase